MSIKSIVIQNIYDDFKQRFNCLFDIIEFITTYDLERLNENEVNIYVDDLINQKESIEDLNIWKDELEELCQRINKIIPIKWYFE